MLGNNISSKKVIIIEFFFKLKNVLWTCFVDIGQNIHNHWESQAENDKDTAISAAEHKVWLEAEHMKSVALEKCRELAKIELEKAVSNLKISNEKSLKVRGYGLFSRRLLFT